MWPSSVLRGEERDSSSGCPTMQDSSGIACFVMLRGMDMCQVTILVSICWHLVKASMKFETKIVFPDLDISGKVWPACTSIPKANVFSFLCLREQGEQCV
jgi:hypothetical protein